MNTYPLPVTWLPGPGLDSGWDKTSPMGSLVYVCTYLPMHICIFFFQLPTLDGRRGDPSTEREMRRTDETDDGTDDDETDDDETDDDEQSRVG